MKYQQNFESLNLGKKTPKNKCLLANNNRILYDKS